MSKVTRQDISFNDSEDGYKCLIKTEFTKEGIPIEGHAYKAVVAFTDLDTNRTYAVLKCERCNYPSVSWSEEDYAEEMSKGFIKQRVGG